MTSTSPSPPSGSIGSTLRAVVSSHPQLCEELPLVHTSRCEKLVPITNSGTITPQPCSVYQESLVYLFYGRPAYRSQLGQQSGEPTLLCPVCFVFRPAKLSQSVRRIVPCDSGSVADDRFVPEIRKADLAHLELHPKIESARRAVSLLFETNANYFIGKVSTGRTFTAGSLEARFYALLQRPGPANFDDRKSSIEVQINQPISLRGQLLFVVLPTEFLDEPDIRKVILYEWNCDPVPYDVVVGSAPADYHAVVRKLVQEKYKDATRI